MPNRQRCAVHDLLHFDGKEIGLLYDAAVLNLLREVDLPLENGHGLRIEA